MSKLIFHYSAMNAGKSAQLLQKNHNLDSKGFTTTIYTSSSDDRYGTGKVTSRVGIQADALTFTKETKFLEEPLGDCRYLFIDEAQFLSKKQVLDLTTLVDEKNITIFCYGIRTDFKGEPFEGATYLMAWSDDIVEIPSYDSNAKKAMMNIRTSSTGKRVWHGTQVQVGLNYETVHRSEFNLRKAIATGPQSAKNIDVWSVYRPG